MTKEKPKFELNKLTPKQELFIEIYCANYGIKSARQCAIEAGYEKESAHTRANEMLDYRKNINVYTEIQNRLASTRDSWEINRDKHLAALTKIRDDAIEQKNLGTAAKCEELRGKIAGLYIERNITLTKELTEEEIDKKMKAAFTTTEEIDALGEYLKQELFPTEKKDKK